MAQVIGLLPPIDFWFLILASPKLAVAGTSEVNQQKEDTHLSLPLKYDENLFFFNKAS